MRLAEALDVRPGVISVVGSGGKTSLLAALARELPGTVVLTTTTHILPFTGVPLVTSADADDVRAALAESRVVCVGSQAEKNGKLYARYRALADKEEKVLFGGALVVVLAAEVEDRVRHRREVVLADLQRRVAVFGGEHRHDRGPAEIVARRNDYKME